MNFHQAVQEVLTKSNAQDPRYVYAVRPIDGDIDRMIVSDGVAFDFGVVLYDAVAQHYYTRMLPVPEGVTFEEYTTPQLQG